MRPLMLEEIRKAVHGRWLRQGFAATVNGLSIDSRTARHGDLFVAIRGPRHDGHVFCAQAAKAGCIAAVVRRDSEPPPEVASLFGAGLIGVAETTTALGELAAYHRSLVPATVVAVTGSNGKTTTKGMIHHILSRWLVGSCSPKSFNNEIGVPLTLLGARPGDDYLICEVGSNCPGEIAALGRMARPDVAVITSVAPAHLQKLTSVGRIAAEKASLVGELADDGLAIVYSDSEELDKALRFYRRRTIRFGVSDDADLRLTGYQQDFPAQRFELNGRLWVHLPLPGRHNALNALAAIAVAQRFGVEQDQAAAALADFEGMEMRLERLTAGDVTIINDAYNANPASVLAAADVLAGSPGKRKVVIVGDMLELGDQGPSLHLKTGRDIAARSPDLLIGVGPLGRYIAMGAAECGLKTETFDSSVSACRGVPALLCSGDLVLIKGSRATAMERLVEPIRAAFTKRPARAKRKKSKGSTR